MTSLKDLLAKATFDPNQLVKRSVEWNTTVNGEEVKNVFDIFIVSQLSFAASDRIYSGSRKDNDDSAQCRMIVERVRLGENGEERIPLEVARTFPAPLGWAIASAVYKLDEELNPSKKESKDAKESSQEQNSGTN
jgi:acyl-CoA synthetase (AMP-forming)/AMP-acid ligase II